MSFFRSDPLRWTRRLWPAAAAFLLALALAPAGPFGKAHEATARGRKADITWVEPDGSRVTVHAREIRYGYYRRVYLSVPRDGLNYRDEERHDKGIPLGNHLVRLSKIDRVVFEREEQPDAERPRLVITITKANGRTVTGEGKDLPGTDHPLSPWIQFTVDGIEKRIDLHPLATRETLLANPRLELIQIVL